jgi:nitrogen fixation protein FixH
MLQQLSPAAQAQGWVIGRLREYRWPLFVGGLLAMSIGSQGVLVWFATRPDSPRPIANYYQKSLEWDAETAVIEASRQLGWKVTLDIPTGTELAVGARRPVDVTVADRYGYPVTELVGRLVAVRPADIRLNGESELVELPHRAGSYRTLAALTAPGLWELHLDTRRGDTRFVHTERVVVPLESAP